MLLRIQRCKYNQQRLKQQTTEANITRHNTNQITEQTALRTKRSTSSVSKFYDQKAQRQTFDSKRKKGHWYLKIKRWPTQRLIQVKFEGKMELKRVVSDLENSFCCCYGMKASSSLNGSLVSCIFPTDEGGKSDIFSKGKNVLLSPSSTIIYSFYTYFHHYIQSENKLCNIRCGTTVQATKEQLCTAGPRILLPQ